VIDAAWRGSRLRSFIAVLPGLRERSCRPRVMDNDRQLMERTRMDALCCTV
jgi:hypothetical protein